MPPLILVASNIGGRRLKFKTTNIFGNNNTNNVACSPPTKASNHPKRVQCNTPSPTTSPSPSPTTTTSTSTSPSPSPSPSPSESRLAHKEWCTHYTESMCEDCEYIFTGIQTYDIFYGWLWLRVFCG